MRAGRAQAQENILALLRAVLEFNRSKEKEYYRIGHSIQTHYRIDDVTDMIRQMENIATTYLDRERLDALSDGELATVERKLMCTVKAMGLSVHGIRNDVTYSTVQANFPDIISKGRSNDPLWIIRVINMIYGVSDPPPPRNNTVRNRAVTPQPETVAQAEPAEEPVTLTIYVSPSDQYDNEGEGDYGFEAVRMQQLANILIPILHGRGHTVRGGTNTIKLIPRINASDADSTVDIHVALHSNAGGGTGPETWYLTGKESGEKLARAIQNKLEVLKGHGRGVKPGVLTGKEAKRELGAVAPSVIVEVAFHDNPSDVAWMLGNWNAIANAIADGIDDYAASNYTALQR